MPLIASDCPPNPSDRLWEVSWVSSQALNEAQELAPMADELLRVESAVSSAEAQASF